MTHTGIVASIFLQILTTLIGGSDMMTTFHDKLSNLFLPLAVDPILLFLTL